MEEKKNLPTTYNPKEFEERIYKTWEEKKYFTPVIDKSKKPFSIVMPPPNITGRLHLGHALDNTLQDMLIRFKRMQGYCTLWLPGQDHASIATEVKVENELLKQGLVKKEMGREAFLEKVWEWSDEYRGHIREQLKKMGVSADFSREAFTMDENLNKAVRTVFVKLYNEGLIYQGNRITNWCPKCTTALSDAEIEYEEKEGSFWHINYPLSDGSGFLEIATTRPETLLGDTAVAVNPNDDRFKHLIGKTLKLPLTDREIPVVGDEYVDMEFGTGAVKITPAHDPNDFEVGKRHNLPQIRVMDDHGVINELGGKYQGLDRYEARKQMVEDLDKLGLLVKIKPHTHNVGTHDRCGTVIEPIISKQWYVKMESLAKPAIEAVRGGKTKFVPERFDKIYFNWMENIQDWCISRQLWWGHRIPVFYCNDCNHMMVEVDAPCKCSKCGSENLRQDEDVLDTWFSSALWPFATLGWPDNTKLLETYYPNSCLVTGYDIIPFWVNRMTFQGEKLLGKRPFKDCLIHGLIRDKQGRKFSKSLGNGIDPFDMVKLYGADSLRYYLATDVAPGTDMRFDEEKIKATWNYINKIWNASRFVLTNIEGLEKITLDNLKPEDKWILTKFMKCVHTTKKFMDKYEFNNAGATIYDFVWSSFCDNYIEMAKYSIDSEVTKSILCYVLTGILKLLQPFMPYVTDEIYNMLPIKDAEDIMISEYPKYSKKYIFEDEEKVVDDQIAFIKNFRNIKAENNITKDMKVMFDTEDDNDLIVKMLKIKENIVTKPLGIRAYKVFSSRVKAQIFFEKVLTDADIAAKEAQIKMLTESINRREKLLSNENYVNKAPQNIVAMDRQKLEEEKKKLEELMK